MLQTKLRDCTDCINVLNLLCDIDKKIAFYSCNKINSLTLLLNLPYDKEVLSDLLKYKRILTYRLFYPCYADVELQTIVSRVKILLNK